MRPSQAADAAAAEVLRMSRFACGVIGVGMTQIVLQPPLLVVPYALMHGVLAIVFASLLSTCSTPACRRGCTSAR